MAKVKVKVKNGKISAKALRKALAKDPRTPLKPSRESLAESAQRSALIAESLPRLENHELGDLLATGIFPRIDAARAAMTPGFPAAR